VPVLAEQPLIVPGHAKQPVSNPLLAEARQYHALISLTLSRLKLDVPAEAEAEKLPPGINPHRAGGYKRWRSAGAT
jgi:hypothetical protein